MSPAAAAQGPSRRAAHQALATLGGNRTQYCRAKTDEDAPAPTLQGSWELFLYRRETHRRSRETGLPDFLPCSEPSAEVIVEAQLALDCRNKAQPKRYGPPRLSPTGNPCRLPILELQESSASRRHSDMPPDIEVLFVLWRAWSHDREDGIENSEYF